MGSRNPDRIPIRMWREHVETLWDMQQRGWQVISHCRTCGLMMAVDLDVLIWKMGARASLWNRKPPCRRLGCGGRAVFEVKLPGVGYYQALEAPWPPGKPPAR